MRFASCPAPIVDQLDVSGLEVEKVEAARETIAPSPSLCNAMEPIFIGTSRSHLAPVMRGAENAAVETVYPVEALLLDIPERSLAERGFDVDDDFDLHVFPPKLRIAAVCLPTFRKLLIP